MALKCLHEFLDGFYLGVDLICLLCDKELWAAMLK
jgi:hypothetical protein